MRRALLTWYDRHKRDLPWRRRGDDAYAQLLAEFMLQQTQVATVIPYFDRFIARFPTIRDLAGASRDEVLSLWSGLGYYSRARNLHSTAQQIVERFDARVPDGVDDLISLPGIGRYTAGAIASVAYDRRAPILDGNVVRVLARLFAISDDPAAPQTREQLWTLAEDILPRKRCGDFNQALMELGATICSPQSPQCLLCPLMKCCEASNRGLTQEIPPPRRRAKITAIEIVVAAIAHEGRLLFMQRPQKGLWAGLWELPTEPIAHKENYEPARGRLLASLPFSCCIETQSLTPVTRILTHRHMTFHTYRGIPRNGSAVPEPYRWLDRNQLRSVGLSRACEAILKQLDFE